MKLIYLLVGLLIVAAGGYFVYISLKPTNLEKGYLSKSSGKFHVAASFYPMYFFASRIGGDKATVFDITPLGAEPHEYEPTTQDITKIESSDMLVLNGGSLETWGDRIKADLPSKTVVVVAGDKFVTKKMQESGKTVQDPHVWLDPVLAKQEAESIEKGYEKIDPKDAVYFQTNEKNLESQLDALDQSYKKGLANCILHDFVTSHAAFSYLSQRYGLTQIAISGISPDSEPSLQQLAEVTNLVKQKGIQIIFFESLVSPKLSQTIAGETGATTMVLDPIEGISQDNIKAGKNYITVMQENLQALEKALVCKNSDTIKQL